MEATFEAVPIGSAFRVTDTWRRTDLTVTETYVKIDDLQARPAIRQDGRYVAGTMPRVQISGHHPVSIVSGS